MPVSYSEGKSPSQSPSCHRYVRGKRGPSRPGAPSRPRTEKKKRGNAISVPTYFKKKERKVWKAPPRLSWRKNFAKNIRDARLTGGEGKIPRRQGKTGAWEADCELPRHGKKKGRGNRDDAASGEARRPLLGRGREMTCHVGLIPKERLEE